MAEEAKKTEDHTKADTEKNPDTKAEAGKGADEARAKAEMPHQADAAKAPTKKKKKGKKRSLQVAHVSIQASYNNTIITVSEPNGNVVCWASSGSCGFKGTRKATPYAASVAAENALNKAKALGVERVHVSVKGIGSGRDQALRAISATGVSIESISDRTAIPHNGCRPRKARRV